MELELATLADIAGELLKRNVRFVLISLEHTNSERQKAACFSGKGAGYGDLAHLFDVGREVAEGLEEDGGGDREGKEA